MAKFMDWHFRTKKYGLKIQHLWARTSPGQPDLSLKSLADTLDQLEKLIAVVQPYFLAQLLFVPYGNAPEATPGTSAFLFTHSLIQNSPASTWCSLASSLAQSFCSNSSFARLCTQVRKTPAYKPTHECPATWPEADCKALLNRCQSFHAVLLAFLVRQLIVFRNRAVFVCCPLQFGRSILWRDLARANAY